MLTSYPRFVTGNKVNVKFQPLVGYIEGTSYEKLLKIFGPPTYSIEQAQGSELDDLSTVVWHVLFESGDVVKISDKKQFGHVDSIYKIREWKINSNNPQILELIKDLLDLHK